MIIMAVDHVRDFILFSLTAGLGAFLWFQRGRTRAELSRFLLTRGLWLIVLELTVMRFTYAFNYSGPVLLVVLWVLGLSMVVLAGLIYLPPRVLAVLSVAVILLHNLLDAVKSASLGAWAPVWKLLHVTSVFPMFGLLLIISYPLVPWFAVMSAGFCFGRVFLLEPARRQRILLWTGVGLSLAFLAVRGLNVYGDPSPWKHQPTAVYTLLSFLNCTKYPPSLLYLLMTLGPALMLLSWLDQKRFSGANPLIVFGRVPLFYFVSHFFLAHLIACVLMLVRYGSQAWHLVRTPFPSFGGDPAAFPVGFGWPLWVVYLVWFLLVAGLYLPCRWFARKKAEGRQWWLSYL